MSELNILDNDRAMTILRTAVDALHAIGVPCMLAPMSLPQGMSVSLHAGSGLETAIAANIAATAGGEYAGAAATHAEFVSKVNTALADPEMVGLVRPPR
jgi:hypothetical protein